MNVSFNYAWHLWAAETRFVATYSIVNSPKFVNVLFGNNDNGAVHRNILEVKSEFHFSKSELSFLTRKAKLVKTNSECWRPIQLKFQLMDQKGIKFSSVFYPTMMIY